MSGIRLHPTKGINPHMTFCRRCGGESPEIILLGADEKVRRCSNCERQALGMKRGVLCPGCKAGFFEDVVRVIEENEKLPSREPCDRCAIEIKEHAAIVADGGLYFRCAADSMHEGVIKPSEMTRRIREEQGVPAPKPLGITISAESCPKCNEAKLLSAVKGEEGDDGRCRHWHSSNEDLGRCLLARGHAGEHAY